MALPWQTDEADYDLPTTKFSPESVARWKYIQSPSSISVPRGVQPDPDYKDYRLYPDAELGDEWQRILKEEEAIYAALQEAGLKRLRSVPNQPIYGMSSTGKRIALPQLDPRLKQPTLDDRTVWRNEAQRMALERSAARDTAYYKKLDEQYRNPDGSWNQAKIAAANERDAYNNFPGLTKQYIAPSGEVRWGGDMGNVGQGKLVNLRPVDLAGGEKIEFPREWLRPTPELEEMGGGARARVQEEKQRVGDWLNRTLTAIKDAEAATMRQDKINAYNNAFKASLQKQMNDLGIREYAYKTPKEREQEEKNRIDRHKETGELVRRALQSKKNEKGDRIWKDWDIDNAVQTLMKAGGPTAAAKAKLPPDIIAALPRNLQSVSEPPPEPQQEYIWQKPEYGVAPRTVPKSVKPRVEGPMRSLLERLLQFWLPATPGTPMGG